MENKIKHLKEIFLVVKSVLPSILFIFMTLLVVIGHLEGEMTAYELLGCVSFFYIATFHILGKGRDEDEE